MLTLRNSFLGGVFRAGNLFSDILVLVLSFLINLHLHKMELGTSEVLPFDTFSIVQYWTHYFFLIVLITLTTIAVFPELTLSKTLNQFLSPPD